MATNTYVALDKVTLGSAASSVTFSSISGSYTDLILVVDGTWSGSNNFEAITLVFNSDTGANYSRTVLQGNGSSASSSRESTANWGLIASDKTSSVIHIMNYANTTTYKTSIARSGSGNYTVRAVAGLWRSTNAITSIEVKTASQNFNSGCTFSLYGIRAEGVNPTAKATGGAVYSDSTYYYHVFSSTGTFTPTQSLTADILVVAGGGGGGGFTGGNGNGGGGAGGLLAYSSQSLSATGYTCTVGAGGTGGLTASGSTNGGNSQFGALTASVGGGRGAHGGSASNGSSSGGSGGGGQGSNDLNYVNGSAGTAGQGYAGGNGYNSGGTPGGGGGGGAGGAGATGGVAIGGAGGVGATSSLINAIGAATGAGQLVSSNYYFAGGGAGSTSNSGSGTASGGYGGGGTGYYDGGPVGGAGTANTGGGGGAGRAVAGGNGGSGIIVVRYAKA